MEADSELQIPFFPMALGTLAQGGPVQVTCLSAARAASELDMQIEVLLADAILGLAALGHALTGVV